MNSRPFSRAVAVLIAVSMVIAVPATLAHDATAPSSAAHSPVTAKAYGLPPAIGRLGRDVGPSANMVHVDTRGESTAPEQGAINPLEIHDSEPAPMGIADYGITSPGAGAYTYSTEAVRGVISLLSDVETYNSSVYWGPTELGFQLNSEIYFETSSGSSFTYWTQDVILYNSTTDQIVQIIDNVWNQSSTSAEMSNQTIQGNGSVSSGSSGDWYAYGTSSSDPGGEGQTWQAGGSVVLEMDAFETDTGAPGVAFLYNDGYGAYAYDVVDFPWATQLSAFYGFVVSGSMIDPWGSPYDLELIMGGPGSGSQTYQEAGNVKLQLLEWNGENFESPTNAFNFGSETAEGVENSEGIWEYNIVSGNMTSHLIAGDNGDATPAQLYTQDAVGFLNFNDTGASGTLFINGTPTPFEDGGAFLTLYPGHYHVNVTIGTTTTYLGYCALKPGVPLNVTLSEVCPGGTSTASPSSTNPLLASIDGIPVYLLLVLLIVVIAVVAVVVGRSRRRPSAPTGTAPGAYAPPGPSYGAPAPPATPSPTGAPEYAPPAAYVPPAAPTPAPSSPPAYTPPPTPVPGPSPPPAYAPAPAAAPVAAPPVPQRACPRCGTVSPANWPQCPRCGLYFGPVPPAQWGPPAAAYAQAPPAQARYAPPPTPAYQPPPAPAAQVAAAPRPAPAAAPEAPKFCPQCGTAPAPGSTFCAKCGYDLRKVG